jgi:hypothetical protein
VTGEWTAPQVERAEPDFVAAERRALEQWLDYHCAILQTKCAGLSAEQLRARAVPPPTSRCSAWSGTAPTLDGADAEADLDTYRREIVAARLAVADQGLDDVVPFRWGGPDRDIRWICVHMIEEYSRHNGHADLVRECIDVRTADQPGSGPLRFPVAATTTHGRRETEGGRLTA